MAYSRENKALTPTQLNAVRRLQEMFAESPASGTLLSEELITERRAEVAAEAAEIDSDI